MYAYHCVCIYSKAALAGSTCVMDVLYESGQKPPEQALQAAGAAATTDSLQWLFDKGLKYTPKVGLAAARNAPLAVLQYLDASEQVPEWSETELRQLLLVAGIGGKLDSAKWLRDVKRAPWPLQLVYRNRKWTAPCLEWYAPTFELHYTFVFL
jgi:hypothetical protein